MPSGTAIYVVLLLMQQPTFDGTNAASARASVERMLARGEDGLTFLPDLFLMRKVEAYHCGNARALLCIKSEVDSSDYACLGKIVHGKTMEEIRGLASSLPRYDCQTQSWHSWHNNSLKTDAGKAGAA